MATARAPIGRIPSLLRLRAPAFEHSTRYRVTCWALLLWWIASFYPILSGGDSSESLASAAEATAHGSLYNQLLVITFAALGAIYLPRAYRLLRKGMRGRVAIFLLGAYLLWAGVSIIWSVDRLLTFRRLGETTLLLIGTIGLGAGFYAATREQCLTLAKHVLYANIISVIVLIEVWGSLGHVGVGDLLDPDWSLKGDTMVSYFVFPAAYGIIAALLLFSSSPVKKTWIVTSLVLILFAMKSRTALAGALAVALLIYSRLANKGVARTMASVLAAVLLLAQVDLATGGHVIVRATMTLTESFPEAVPYLSIGNGVEELLSLDGHLPLWSVLWPMYLQHPFLGHGFGAFWNPSRFDIVQAEISWPAVLAHNGYLDEMLATGVIGLSLFLAFWFYGISSGLQRTQTDRRGGYLVVGWFLLFLVSNTMGSIMQFYFQYPTLFSSTALFALIAGAPAYAGFMPADLPRRNPEV